MSVEHDHADPGRPRSVRRHQIYSGVIWLAGAGIVLVLAILDILARAERGTLLSFLYQPLFHDGIFPVGCACMALALWLRTDLGRNPDINEPVRRRLIFRLIRVVGEIAAIFCLTVPIVGLTILSIPSMPTVMHNTATDLITITNAINYINIIWILVRFARGIRTGSLIG